MSVDLRNAQYIQIPESGTIYKLLGTIWQQNNPKVDKITDSNGNVVWGRPSKYPYRKLEYIHFNGAEYIDTAKTPSTSSYMRMDVKLSLDTTTIWSFCGSVGSNGSDAFCCGTRNSGLARGEIGNKNTSGYTLATNTGYNFHLYYYSGKTGKFEVNSFDDQTNLWASGTISSITYYGSTISNVYIGCKNNNGTAQEYMQAKIYGFILRSSDYNNVIFNGIPVQRRSDNKCGMYDLITNTFYPMQGTSTTSGAAGPIIDEYWDLTAI